MTQFFRGNLAGLTVRPGKLADKKVIDCLYTCKEGLDLQVPEDSGKGVQVTLSAHLHRHGHSILVPRPQMGRPVGYSGN
jgi:hypothetical protein